MGDKRLSRILGIDYGERRIGLAISDPMLVIAKPFSVIDQKIILDPFSTIADIITEKNIISIVVGLPITMKGNYSKQTETVMKFIKNLESKFNIPIISIDERLSSISAKKILDHQSIKIRYSKGNVDKTAAAIILQEYLDSNYK